MGQFVIVAYRPRPGKEKKLLDLLREHVPILRAEGLVTDRAPLVMRAANGTIVEVFEWKSASAIDAAHHNEAVKSLWDRFAEACEYQNLADLEESRRPFSSFEPVIFESESGM